MAPISKQRHSESIPDNSSAPSSREPYRGLDPVPGRFSGSRRSRRSEHDMGRTGEVTKRRPSEVLVWNRWQSRCDSRLAYDEVDVKGALQSLEPTFPGLVPPSQCDFYWSRNFAVVEESDILLVIVNSSAFHGINSDRQTDYKEYEHGRISRRTIEEIVRHIPTNQKRLNILLTHHHFYKMIEFPYRIIVPSSTVQNFSTRLQT
jgi:hypothetical protein